MARPVIKATSYSLVYAPDMVLSHGTTLTMERAKDPQSSLLTDTAKGMLSFEEMVAYPPNQCYIGEITPYELKNTPRPWYQNPVVGAKPLGTFGQILNLDAFIALLKICDSFDLVELTPDFTAQLQRDLVHHVCFTEGDLLRLGAGSDPEMIKTRIENHKADPINYLGSLVGCIKQAHDVDPSLNSHVLFENMVAKASGVLALKDLLRIHKIDPNSIEYVIETSEEACGDMNQRGGGNFAKAIGEVCGLKNATGSDTRAFCAGPSHGIVNAAALVQAGVYKNVVVLAGGATAKLGMNARDHLKKGVPVLETMLGAFAVLIGEDDGISPVIRLDAIGRHRIGSGASPQAVTEALVTDPLGKIGLTVLDVETYSVEMQNPELTVPAGAGDVPLANYKMIGALGVKRGDLEKADLARFVEEHGMPGWAPTQGHIPSGVPYLGFAREAMLKGERKRVMIIGKGSLFLARMTNLFDGVSYIVEKNEGKKEVPSQKVQTAVPVIAVTLLGSELGEEELLRGAELASRNQAFQVVVLGSKNLKTSLPCIEVSTEKEQHQVMERLLSEGKIHAAVTLHYSFPLGTATIGRAIAPATGKEVLIATTTGATSSDRVQAMVKNTILGLATAKALGNPDPTVGILNIEGAQLVIRKLEGLRDQGYSFSYASSKRQDGGALLRGNDVLAGSADMIVTDSLTGNILMKMLSAQSTGGSYEAVGYGYGPGVGGSVSHPILILSRASGAPVVANAILYAYELVRGDLKKAVQEELQRAKQAGWKEEERREKKEDLSIRPAKKIVTEEITGIDVLELEDATEQLAKAMIYGETGMGCVGPVVLVASEDLEKAIAVLREAKYL